MSNTKIAIVMGSQSDWTVMERCTKLLQSFNVPFSADIVSAHRTPQRLYDFATGAQKKGFEIIIAAAGGAAHLPGMIAAITTLPVLGVPIPTKYLKGMDSLLSIVQMPSGVPVGTLAIGESGAVNAAWLAMQILAVHDSKLSEKIVSYRTKKANEVANTKIPKSR